MRRTDALVDFSDACDLFWPDDEQAGSYDSSEGLVLANALVFTDTVSLGRKVGYWYKWFARGRHFT